MKIALIGGAGFIGHHLALHFASQKHDVTIIDSLMVNNYFHHIGNPLYSVFLKQRMDLLDKAGVDVWRIDARDYSMMNAALMPLKPDAIIHLSAVAHIDRANKDPYSTFDHNLRTLENSLDVARSLGSPHVVYFSSSTVYGTFPEPVVTEQSRCNPFGIYGALKISGEYLTQAYRDVYGLDCTIVRPCALYGPRCVSGRVGQKFIEAARQGKPITIFGDGEIYEDFTYIEDLVQGIDLIVSQRERAGGETFNITAGQAHSLNELAGIISAVYEVPIEHGPSDPDKPHRGTLSVQKARDILGYNPTHDLERGMAKYISWYDPNPWQRGKNSPSRSGNAAA